MKEVNKDLFKKLATAEDETKPNWYALFLCTVCNNYSADEALFSMGIAPYSN